MKKSMKQQKMDIMQSPDDNQSIVIVDDLPDNLRLLSSILKEKGYRVRPAPSGRAALATIFKEPPDLVLLDIMMPEVDGYEVCRQLKETKDFSDIPVIFLSALNEVEDKIKAFQSGGVDFITKPFQAEEVLARVNTHLTIRTQQKTLALQNEKLIIQNALITRQAEKLEKLACRDPLTGLSNRREFLDRAGKEESRFRRSGKPFTLLMIDIDNFKSINDTYGHQCGDLVLVGISECLKKNLRKQDLVARWGGEEFIVLLLEADQEGALGVAEKIRHAINDARHQWDNILLSVTATIGVCEHDGNSHIDETIRRSDDALYRGKHAGRNIVIGAAAGS